MNNKFKRSIMGYDPHRVKEVMKAEKEKLNRILEKYEEELSLLTRENDNIKNEIESIIKQIADYSRLKEKLLDILYNDHLQVCEAIYDYEKKTESMVKHKIDILQALQYKNTEIKMSVSKLLNDIDAIIKN